MLWLLVLLVALPVMADALLAAYVMTWGDLYAMFRRVRARAFRMIGIRYHGRRH